MAGDAMRAALVSSANGIVEAFPARGARILEAKKALCADALASAGGDAVPPALAAGFDVLTKEAAQAVLDAKELAAFVRLHEPPCEDGNNFYVGMQDEIAKLCEAAAKTIDGLLLSRVEYLEKRADLKEKVAPKITTDESTTSNSSESKKTENKKEGPEETSDKKADSSTSTTKKTSTWEVCAERKEALSRLDAAWQGKLAGSLTTIVYELARVVDCVQKNMDKILDPRGTGEGGNRGLFY
jgi:hypothetical protein